MKGALTLLFHKMKSRLFADPWPSINYCLLFIKGRGRAPLARIIIHRSVPPHPHPVHALGEEAAEPAKDVPSAF